MKFSWPGWMLAGILCMLWTVSVAPFLAGLRWIEPIVPLLVFLALFRSPWMSFLFALGVSVFIDLYQLSDYSVMTVFSLVFVSLVTLVSRRVLTNRSFYAGFFLLLFGRVAAFLLGWFSQGAIGLWNPATMLPLTAGEIAARFVSDAFLLLLLFWVSSRFERTLHSSPTVGGLVGYF